MNSTAFIKNLKQLFAECDTDGNGSLGRHEFNQLCTKIGLNKEAAEEAFERLDIDKNDRITFDEFTAGFNQYKQQSSGPSSSSSSLQPTSSSSSPVNTSDHGSNPRLASPVANSSQSHSPQLSNAGSDSNPGTPPPPPSHPHVKSANRLKLSGSATTNLSRQQKLAASPVASSIARKNASPLGVLSLGSTASSSGSSNLIGSGGGRSSSSGGDHQSYSESSVSVDTGVDSSVCGSKDPVIVYSSEAFDNNDYEQSGSGQFGSLISSNGSLNQVRNMQDLLDSVQKLQTENQILSQIFFKDKREREEYINQLGEEFDLQVREVEERAHRRAKEELETEKKRLREMMQAERETLQHHYHTIEKMSKLIKSSDGKLEEGESIDKVRSKLEDTYMENRQLKKSLLDTKTDVALIWKEMEKLKRQYEDKLSNAYQRNDETRNECDHIKQQLNLMKDSNRKLQDASDVITSYITEKVDPVIKNAGAEADDQSLGAGSSLTGTYKLGTSSHSGSRKGSILSHYMNGDLNTSNDEPDDLNSLEHTNSRVLSRIEDISEERLSNASGSTGKYTMHTSKSANQIEDKQSISGLKRNGNRSSEGLSSEERKSTSSTSKHIEEADKRITEPSLDSATSNSINEDQSSSIESSPHRQHKYPSSNPFATTHQVSNNSTSRPNFTRNASIAQCKAQDSDRDDESRDERISNFKSYSLDCVEEPDVEPADGPSRATFDIILVGDSFVGKSSFAARFMEGTFVQGLISNCSIDFKTRAYKVDGVNYTVNLWDTAGQERFRSITASYFRKADGIVLMYDVTDKRSYLNVRNWMSTIIDTASENVAVLLVGNKIDLRRRDNKDKCVPTKEGQRLAKEYSIVFLETSVKTGTNLVPSMGKLIRLIAKNNIPIEEDKDRIKLNGKSKTFNCMPKSC